MEKSAIRKYERSGPITRGLKAILRLIIKKPRILGNTDIPDQAILLANHNGAAGPFILSLYFPRLFVPWGAHPMTEGYSSRWRYLYHIFYQQKLKYKRFPAFLLATLFGIISKRLYVGMHVIPTYQDSRLLSTYSISMEHLDCGNPILVFPEESEEGYFEVLSKYNAGFVVLAKTYLSKRQVDLPIYPIYFSKKEGIILVGDPEPIGKLLSSGMSRDEIAEHFRARTNALYSRYKQE
jgi:hypothetical protein